MDYKELIPGAVGSVFNAYIGHPFDTVRVRLQNVNNNYSSPLNCVTDTYKTEGTKGFFRGATSSLWEIMAESSVVFASNEILKQKIYGVDRKTPPDIYTGYDDGVLIRICINPSVVSIRDN